MPYLNQSQLLSTARRCLMLPHTRGEASSIAEALSKVKSAFYQMDESGLDDDAQGLVKSLREFLDTS